MPLADQLAMTGMRDVPVDPKGLKLYEGLAVSGWFINVTPGAVAQNFKADIKIVTDQNPNGLFFYTTKPSA